MHNGFHAYWRILQAWLGVWGAIKRSDSCPKRHFVYSKECKASVGDFAPFAAEICWEAQKRRLIAQDSHKTFWQVHLRFKQLPLSQTLVHCKEVSLHHNIDSQASFWTSFCMPSHGHWLILHDFQVQLCQALLEGDLAKFGVSVSKPSALLGGNQSLLASSSSSLPHWKGKHCPN